MNIRRGFLVGFGAGLLLMMGGAFAQTGKPAVPPPDTVRNYLAARARHDLAGQYALFSTTVQSQIPFAQFDTAFASDKARPHAAEDGMSPLLVCASEFFMDSHGLSGYQFTVVGPDPADPQVVLVHAQPPGIPADKVFLLKIVTSDTGSGPQFQMLPSFQRTSPRDFADAAEHARGIASLSNLRQIGLALVTYPETHDGRLPNADTWVDSLLPWWKKTAQPDGSAFDPVLLFRDPTAPEGQRWNYAFNRALSGAKLTDIKDPATTVMLFESTAGVKNAADTGQSLPRPGRHHGGDYYVFANGHAQWFPNGTKLSYRLDGK